MIIEQFRVLHETCELLGQTIQYQGRGFSEETGWTERVTLRAVAAYQDVVKTSPKPRNAAPKRQVKTHAALVFEALCAALADHPRHPLGESPEKVAFKIQEAYEVAASVDH